MMEEKKRTAKQVYVTPTMEVYILSCDDILTTSGGFDGPEDEFSV